MEIQKVPRPGKEFWYATFFGWTADFIMNFVLDYHFRHTELELVMFADMFMAITGILMSILLRYILVYYKFVSLDLKKTIRVVIVSTILFSAVLSFFNILYLYIYQRYVHPNMIEVAGERVRFEITGMLMWRMYSLWQVTALAWNVAYFGYHFFVNFRKAEIEKWKYFSMANEAKWMMLKAQIQPHFLFNSLNNISSLISENSGRARQMIQHLSGLLRKSMHLTDQTAVTIEEEIKMVKDYLELLSIQFEHKLKYEFSISENSYGVYVPPLTLQVLVENAVVHGIEKSNGGGSIEITMHCIKQRLTIHVVNSGKMDGEFVPGLGIKNILTRLEIMYGKEVEFDIRNSKEGNKVMVSLMIPDIRVYQHEKPLVLHEYRL